jgi:hypothetical protein
MVEAGLLPIAVLWTGPSRDEILTWFPTIITFFLCFPAIIDNTLIPTRPRQSQYIFDTEVAKANAETALSRTISTDPRPWKPPDFREKDLEVSYMQGPSSKQGLVSGSDTSISLSGLEPRYPSDLDSKVKVFFREEASSIQTAPDNGQAREPPGYPNRIWHRG